MESDVCTADGCTAVPARDATVELLLGSTRVDGARTDSRGVAVVESPSVGLFDVVAHVGDLTSPPARVEIGGGSFTDVTVRVPSPIGYGGASTSR
ncbi:hypothetical protein GCM10009809_25940 [Isoptericola hypogeus]|uniref:Carboxypeptidase regulatory-like domain-containing protein n=1 Tax=Isoptericola hypogeus TaxID=300179 RepID=A0ABP4VNB9_9MICO